jgi:hypothetical protein
MRHAIGSRLNKKAQRLTTAQIEPSMEVEFLKGRVAELEKKVAELEASGKKVIRKAYHYDSQIISALDLSQIDDAIARDFAASIVTSIPSQYRGRAGMGQRVRLLIHLANQNAIETSSIGYDERGLLDAMLTAGVLQ